MSVFIIAIVAFGMLAAGDADAGKPVIYHLDLRGVWGLPQTTSYDIQHAAVCIQGLANRDAPRVFITFLNDDATWLTRLRESGGLCDGWEIRNVADVHELVSIFRGLASGVVLYDADPNSGVTSTSLAATTAAACENAIAVRKDTAAGSMYNYLVNDINGPQLPVIADLTSKFAGSGTIWGTTRPSTGSAKCDAYLWASANYLDTGRCDPSILFYTLDLYALKVNLGNHQYSQLMNLDYAVSKKAFCFELSPWGDEVPNDDPTQPLGTDLNTFKNILHQCNVRTGRQKMIKFCGFTNWHVKYTTYGGNGSHGEVATEWETVSICSAYNTYLEADAPGVNYVSNCSFYAALTPALTSRRYVQNPAPTRDDLVSRGLMNAGGTVLPGNYVMLGMGDYDSVAWPMYNVGCDYWLDSVRGQVNCNWGIDPNASDRAGVLMDYLYRHKTSKDFFMAWDSGAGYVNPTQLRGTRSPSGYPSGVSIWQAHCKAAYRPFDYSISAWLLNGSNGNTSTTDYQDFAPFSGDGIGAHATSSAMQMVNNVPVNRMRGDLGMYEVTDSVMDLSSGVNFGWYRTVLWRPSQIKALQDKYVSSGHNHVFLDSFSYYYLLRHYLGGNNNYRATWVSDTIPRVMAAGQTYPVTVTVRNDGWDTWSEASLYRLGHAVVSSGATPANADYDARVRAYLTSGATVAPGQSATFSFDVLAPATNGSYDLAYDMVRENITWFREQNNAEWKKEIVVATNQTDVDTDGDGVPDVTETANGDLCWYAEDRASPTGTITVNSDDPYTQVRAVTLALAATDVGTGIAQMRLANGSTYGDWEPYAASKSWTLPTGNGVKTVCVQYKDWAGNISAQYCDTIIYDTVAPTGSVSIDSGAQYANTATVLLTLLANDGGSGVAQMRLANSASPWLDWEAYSTVKMWTLAGQDGSKTVLVQFRDSAGNTSLTYSDSIFLDTTPPSVPGAPTDGGAFSATTLLVFDWSAATDSGSGIGSYNCRVGSSPGSGDVFDGNVGVALQKTASGAFGAIYYCCAQAVDNAGNASAWSGSSNGIALVQHSGLSVAQARSLADLVSVGIPTATVSAVFDTCFYVTDATRTAGIRAASAFDVLSALSVGALVGLGGLLRTDTSGERWLECTVELH